MTDKRMILDPIEMKTDDGMQHVCEKLPTEAQMDEMLNDMHNSDSKPIIEAHESVKKVLRGYRDGVSKSNDMMQWNGEKIICK